MSLEIVPVLGGKFGRQPQALRGAVACQVGMNQIELGCDRRGTNAFKVRNGFTGRSLPHEQQTKVVVRIAVAGIAPQNGSKLILSQIWLLLRQIYVSQVVASLG